MLLEQLSVNIVCVGCKSRKLRDESLQTTNGWVTFHGVYVCPQCIGPVAKVGHPITAKEIDYLLGVCNELGNECSFTKEQVKSLVANEPLTYQQVKWIGEGAPLTKLGDERIRKVVYLGAQQNAEYQGMAYPCPICHRGPNQPCVGCEAGDAFGQRVAGELNSQHAKGNTTPVSRVCAARTRVGIIDLATHHAFEQYDAQGRAIRNFMPTAGGNGTGYQHLEHHMQQLGGW